MSPEESETDSENGAEDSEEDEERQERAGAKRKLLYDHCHGGVKSFLMFLDRKWNRRASVKSKAMARPRHAGQMLECNPPEGISNWMIQE